RGAAGARRRGVRDGSQARGAGRPDPGFRARAGVARLAGRGDRGRHGRASRGAGAGMSSDAEPGWIARLWGYMLRHRSSLVISLVAAVLGSASQVVVPLIARQIVDSVIIAKSSPLLPWLVLL